MNLSDLLPAAGSGRTRTFWLHGEYGDPQRANFWHLRAVLVETPSETLRRVVEVGFGVWQGGVTLLPAINNCTLWVHRDFFAPKRANYYDLRVLLAALPPEQGAEMIKSVEAEARTVPDAPAIKDKDTDLFSALSSFFRDWGFLKGPRSGDVPRLSDIEELISIFRVSRLPNSGTLVRLKRSRFARSRTKVRLDQLASALGRLAAFANVSHTLEREALKGSVRPRDVAVWIEEALTSDWKAVFRLTGTKNIPDAIKAVRRLVGRTPEAEKQLGDVADALSDEDWVPGAATHAQAVARVVKQRDEALALVNEARSVMFDLEVAHGHPILEKVRSRVESWCERAQALDIVAGPGGKGTKDVEEEA